MKISTGLQRLALAGSLALSGVVGGATLASAQAEPEWEADYYESMLTGYEIEISGSDFEITDVIYQEYDDGENEQVYIESDYSSTQVSFFDDSDSPEDTIELWIDDIGSEMDSFEVVESGVDDDVTWYYAEGEYDDLFFVYFVQVQEDVDGNVDMLESVLTLEGNLAVEIEIAQEDIAIDGDGFMDDVDLDELEDFLSGGTFRGGGDEADDDADDRDASDDDTDDRNTSDDDTDDRDASDEDTSDQDSSGDDDSDEDDSSSSRDRERLPVDDDEVEEDEGGN